MARAKKVVEEAPKKEPEPKLAKSVAEFKAMTKKERMAARQGFAK